MKTDVINEIKIDDKGRLCIFPKNEKFSQIFTLAKEVNWDSSQSFLYSPNPKEWSYFKWYKHIINIAIECNVTLLLTQDTIWTNIPKLLKDEILAH
jgi:hypothetical protein